MMLLRGIDLFSVASTFEKKYLPKDLGFDDLSTKKWPIRPSVKGKDKERPTDWLQLEQYDHFDAYRVDEINGLEV